MTSQPWGAGQWERLAEGESFDGMESWLPYVYPRQDLLPDLLPAGSQVVLVEPRRIGPLIRTLLRNTDPLFRQAGIDLDG